MDETQLAELLLIGFLLFTQVWHLILRYRGDSTGFHHELAQVIVGGLLLLGVFRLGIGEYLFGVIDIALGLGLWKIYKTRGGGGRGETQHAGSLIGQLVPW